MKISIASLLALVAACTAARTAASATSDVVQSANIYKNETSVEVWPEESRAETARALVESTAAPTSVLVNCPSPNDENFSAQITHGRVEQKQGGGYEIYYRVRSNEIRYRCNCKNADLKSFEKYFGYNKLFEVAYRPNLRCYSRDPSGDTLMLQQKFNLTVTQEILFLNILQSTTPTTQVCF